MKRLALAATLFFAAAQAHASPRLALLVGENTGDEGDATLHYAEADASRLARVLRDFGGFSAEDVINLEDVTAEEMRSALITLNSKIRESPNATLLVFYSGHADAEALHLRGSRLKLDELKSLVHGSHAAARVLIIDACRSGAATRSKGGAAAPSFAVDVDDTLSAEGMAILTSSAAGEDSQESDRIGASFFTHFLVSGLVGAADNDSDGKVTLDEAFRYASERTLIATAGTMTGPQHPTYRFELGGQGALILTEPSKSRDRFGELTFPAGNWLVQRSGASGQVVAEIAAESGRKRVSLPVGSYFVTRRERDFLRQGSFPVAAGQATDVAPRAMTEVAYAQVVRKGGTTRTRTWSAFAAAAGQSALGDVGAASGVTLGARLDLRPVTVELAAGVLGTSTLVRDTRGPQGQPVGTQFIDGRAFTGTISALRVFDSGRFSGGLGGSVGALSLDRTVRYRWFIMGPPGQPLPTFAEVQSLGVFAGPTAFAEARLIGRVHARIGAQWLAETVELQKIPGIPSSPSPQDLLPQPVTNYTRGVAAGTLSVGVFF